MLLDTASLYFRAFYGVPDSVKAPDGSPVNAVRGLLDFIARLVSVHRPTHLACCWDEDWRPQWRVDLLPSYKAHRVLEEQAGVPDTEQTPLALDRQVPIIRDVLTALGLAIVGASRYEADDVIATLAEEADMPVDIVTGDRDLFQLIDDARAIRVLYTARGGGRHEIVDEASVVQRYGVLPQQYADFAVLRGDASDGLPGVNGIGAKTAADLLREHGDLISILAAAKDPKSRLGASLRTKVASAADYLAVAPTVVEVARGVALPEADLAIPRPVPQERETFAELVERWGLGSSAERVVAALNVATGYAASVTEE